MPPSSLLSVTSICSERVWLRCMINMSCPQPASSIASLGVAECEWMNERMKWRISVWLAFSPLSPRHRWEWDWCSTSRVRQKCLYLVVVGILNFDYFVHEQFLGRFPRCLILTIYMLNIITEIPSTRRNQTFYLSPRMSKWSYVDSESNFLYDITLSLPRGLLPASALVIRNDWISVWFSSSV